MVGEFLRRAVRATDSNRVDRNIREQPLDLGSLDGNRLKPPDAEPRISLLPGLYPSTWYRATAPVAAIAAPSALSRSRSGRIPRKNGMRLPTSLPDMVPECPVLRNAHRSCRGCDVDDDLGPPVFREVQPVAGRLSHQGRGKGTGPAFPVGPCPDNRVRVADRRRFRPCEVVAIAVWYR